MDWLDTVYIFLYFFSLMYLPWILLAVSFWFTIKGLVYYSWKKMAIGFLIFLPNLIALLVEELEPLLYVLILLPFFQVVMAIKYYHSHKSVRKISRQ